MKKKGITIRGRAAKRKGSRAEISVRNALRSIYPTELRPNVQRVPMSGAGWMKGDVYDSNDTNSCYEVKCQETLVLNDWWRQAKSQASTTRTPILVITQSYRPFYYIMHVHEWLEMVLHTEYAEYTKTEVFGNSRNLFDKMADLEQRICGQITLDDDDCIIIPENFYIEVKKAMYYNNN